MASVPSPSKAHASAAPAAAGASLGVRGLVARVAGTALVGLVCAALLAANTLYFMEAAFGGLPADRRYWDDTAMAVGFYFEGLRPSRSRADPASVVEFQGSVEVYRRLIRNRVRMEGIGAREFWRTIRLKPLDRERRTHVVPMFEDPGRALVLAAGWRAVGGVAPFLLFWLGALLALPALIWIAWELQVAGHGAAAVLFPLLLSASPYVVQTLALPHSAVGFYLLALLVLVALAVYALLAPSAAPGPFLARVVVAALAFALCAVSRAGTLALLPAFLLAVVVGARRAFGPRRRLAAAAVAAALTCLPYALARPAQRHNVWVSVWEGLGDFDTTKSYYWSDGRAREAVAAAGGIPFGDPKTVDAAAEALLREQVLRDVRSDPGWYAVILGKRLLATLSQSKLAPWGPRDGYSLEPPRFHYKYTSTVESLGVGARAVELPLPLLWTPTLVLAVAWMLARRRLLPVVESDRLGRVLGVIGVLALATLPIPVLVSTASGIETQALGLAYLLGAACLAGELLAAGGRWLARAGARGHGAT